MRESRDIEKLASGERNVRLALKYPVNWREHSLYNLGIRTNSGGCDKGRKSGRNHQGRKQRK